MIETFTKVDAASRRYQRGTMITEERAVSAIEFVAGRPLARTELHALADNGELAARLLIEALELKFDLLYEPSRKCLVNGDGVRFTGDNLCECVENFRSYHGAQKDSHAARQSNQ